MSHNNGREDARNDHSGDYPSFTIVEALKLHDKIIAIQLSNSMATHLEERRSATTTQCITGEFRSSGARYTSANKPRGPKKNVSSYRSTSRRERLMAREYPSSTELACQQDPDAPVHIPFCMLKDFIESLTPVTSVEERDDLTNAFEDPPLNNVNKLPCKSKWYGAHESSGICHVGRESNTKIAHRDVTLSLSDSLIAPSSSSDEPQSLASIVRARYVAMSDGYLTQEMSWEVEALEDPKPTAPVTKENLRELDLQSIQNTISLRFDLCFDQGLFFQRVSGAKGSQKRTRARIFYRYMSLELQAIAHNLRGSCKICQQSKSPQYVMQSRLACYFWSLLDLLIILVPDAEKESIRNAIDPEWLTRRVRMGHFEAEKFGTWLHALLIRHCAPMRDAMARDMQEKLVRGASNGDMELLTSGMEVLLSLLENMKIDIANHQIRTFKFLLIADTVSFLRDCFTKMLDKKQIQLKDSRRWYHRARKRSPDRSEFESFMQEFIRLLCTTEDELQLSTTFRYGEDRLHALRNEILDYAHLEVCMIVYRERLGRVSSTHLEQQMVKHRMLQLMTNSDGTSEGVRQHIQDIDLEILRAVGSRSGDTTSEAVPTPPQIKILNNDSTDSPDLEYLLNDQEESALELLSETLFEPSLAFAKKFFKMDTLQISNYQRTYQDQRANKSSLELPIPDITDLSSKVAHMGVIHWQIWAELAYLDES